MSLQNKRACRLLKQAAGSSAQFLFALLGALVTGALGAAQGLLDGSGQDGGKGDSDHRVKNGSGDLGHQCRRRHAGLEALDKQPVPGEALKKVEGCIGQGSGGGGQHRAAVGDGRLAAVPGYQADYKAVGPLGQEGDPALGNVEGIGKIIEHRADA